MRRAWFLVILPLFCSFSASSVFILEVSSKVKQRVPYPLCSQFLRTPGKTHETHTNNRITYVYVYYTAQHYTDRHISGSAMTPRCNKLFWSLKIKILLEFYVIILWQSTFLFAYNQFWWFWYTAGFTTRADIVPYAENCFIPKSRNSVCKKTGKCFVHRWRSRFSQTRV